MQLNFFSAETNGVQRPSKIKAEEKLQIKAKIQDGIYTVGEKSSTRISATYWKTMRAIFDESKKEVKKYVFCSVCKSVLTYDTAGSGTKNIKDHHQACQPGKTFGRFIQKHKTNFSINEKERMSEAAVRFCCKDLRPFYALYGEGLMDLLEEVVGVKLNGSCYVQRLVEL